MALTPGDTSTPARPPPGPVRPTSPPISPPDQASSSPADWPTDGPRPGGGVGGGVQHLLEEVWVCVGREGGGGGVTIWGRIRRVAPGDGRRGRRGAGRGWARRKWAVGKTVFRTAIYMGQIENHTASG